MTIEEVKNTPEVVDRLLDKCVLVDSRAKLRKRLEEVCDMAIKALEHQEPCDDAISRQAVEKITWEEPSYTDALNALTEVREKVRALPSVTPQSKTGHWIDTGSGQECSECGEIQHGYDNFRFYCAKCGSKNVIESEVKE